MQLTFANASNANVDRLYRLEVIVDDRIRDAAGHLQDSDLVAAGTQAVANGGNASQASPASSPPTTIPASDGFDPYGTLGNGAGGYNLSRVIVVTVNPLNDAPTLVDTNPVALPAVQEDSPGSGVGSPPGERVGTLFSGKFQDLLDDVPGGSSSDAFWGVAINGLAVNAAQGNWQYSIDGGTTWVNVGARSDNGALILDSDDKLRFLPAANYHGTPNSLTVRLIETDTNNDSPTLDPTSGSTVDFVAAGSGGITI